MKIHVVQKGDTLWKIAKKYHVDFELLKAANPQLKNPDRIYPGMKIRVPTESAPVKPQPKEERNPMMEMPKHVPVPPAPPMESPLSEVPAPPPQVMMPPQPPIVMPIYPQYPLNFDLNMYQYQAPPAPYPVPMPYPQEVPMPVPMPSMPYPQEMPLPAPMPMPQHVEPCEQVEEQELMFPPQPFPMQPRMPIPQVLPSQCWQPYQPYVHPICGHQPLPMPFQLAPYEQPSMPFYAPSPCPPMGEGMRHRHESPDCRPRIRGNEYETDETES